MTTRTQETRRRRRGLTPLEAKRLMSELRWAEKNLEHTAQLTFELAILVRQYLDDLPESWALLPDGVSPDDNGASLRAIAEYIHDHVARAAGMLEVLATGMEYEVRPFLPPDDDDDAPATAGEVPPGMPGVDSERPGASTETEQVTGA